MQPLQQLPGAGGEQPGLDLRPALGQHSRQRLTSPLCTGAEDQFRLNSVLLDVAREHDHRLPATFCQRSFVIQLTRLVPTRLRVPQEI